jgi:acetyl esterase/lipase
MCDPSAGGNLSLALIQTVLELRRQKRKVTWLGAERDVPLPAGVAVNSPWLDITQSSPSWEANWKYDYLPTPSIMSLTEPPPCGIWPASPPRKSLYIDDALLAHPLATIITARSWEGTPPVFMCTGWELLADEDKFMASKLENDGVTVVFEEYEAMPHCFALILTQLPGSQRCFESWANFIKAAIDDPESIKPKATTIKAKSLEEVKLEISSLSSISPEQMRGRVRAKVEEHSPPETISKL